MKLTLEQTIGQKLMLSFVGMEAPEKVLAKIKNQHLGGFTLFRSMNVVDPAQVHALTGDLQRAAAEAGQPPLLIATDQEGGQLVAIGDGATPFPGNMALGATGSTDLAHQMGRAIGLELAAMGVNVNYAPVCDVSTNPKSADVGTRSFGRDPALVSRMGAAMIAGMQSAGVAATTKHFPGGGDTSIDPHFGVPIVDHDRQRLERVELPPFAQAIEAGARLLMSAHVGIPALNDGLDMPATLSRPILEGLLRGDMGFEGVIISDAMEMGAIAQGAHQLLDIVAATLAGVDLLLLNNDENVQDMAFGGLLHAVKRALIPRARVRASAQHILALKEWLASQPTPEMSVVNSAQHQALAREIAERALTLIRDEAGQLPLRLPAGARLAVVLPRPVDLTPADTSSYIVPGLAAAIRRYHSPVDEFITVQRPSASEIAAIRQQVQEHDLVVVGAISAHTQPEQAALVNALLESGVPLVVVGLRTPYDLATFPTAPTYLCSYGIQEPSMVALAQALWGHIPFRGRLPVPIADLYPTGHGVQT